MLFLASGPSTFTPGARLRERPIDPLLQALRELGAKAERSSDGSQIRVTGPLRGGECTIPGSESSQYLSGLLLAAPNAEGETRIRVEGPLASRPYVDMTLAMMRDRGVRVQEEGDTFIVRGGQRYRQKTYDVPGDWSSAAFLFGAAAVTNGCVNVEGLPLDERDGDARILQHLDALGCCVEVTSDYVSVAGCKPEGTTLDVGATPDLFPVLAAVGAVARGQTTLSGAPHLRHKESDRIHAMAMNLRAFGIECEERADGLRVTAGRPTGATIQSFNDHRIAMACTVLGLAAKEPTTLPDPDVVRKSYPGFVQDLTRIAPGGFP